MDKMRPIETDHLTSPWMSLMPILRFSRQWVERVETGPMPPPRMTQHMAPEVMAEAVEVEEGLLDRPAEAHPVLKA